MTVSRPALTILVVDDEPTLVETLAELLTWEGYRVVTASNGRLALASMRAARPDLVIMDYMMPVLDGLQTIEAMRADPSLESLKVILTTAAPRALPKTGPWDELIIKPHDVELLLDTVRKLAGATASA